MSLTEIWISGALAGLTIVVKGFPCVKEQMRLIFWALVKERNGWETSLVGNVTGGCHSGA
jgi:hypothetical protein